MPTLNSLVGSAATAISSGSYAGVTAAVVTGGVGSIAAGVGALSSSLKIPSLPGLPSMPGLPTLPGLPSLPSIPGLPSMPSLDLKQGVTGAAFSSILTNWGEFKPGVVQDLEKIAADKTAAMTKADGSLSGAAGGLVGSVTGAVSGAVKSVTGAISGIASKVTGAATASGSFASGIASGINAIPGGQKAISISVNNAVGALNNIPGTAGITAAIGNPTATADLLASVKASGSTLSAAALTGKFSLPTLPNLSQGLPQGMSASAMTALTASFGSSGLIGLPKTAFDTAATRGAIAAAMGGQLGPGIQVPNYSGNPATFMKMPSDEEAKKYNENKELIAQATDEAFAQAVVMRNALAAYEKAKNELPQGDAQIDADKATWLAEMAKLTALEKKVADLRAA